MATEKITVPDFGEVLEVVVIEVFVSPGDTVEKEDEIVALESDKAVMEIPAPAAGVVKEVYLKEGDTVKSGDDILLLEVADQTDQPAETGDEIASGSPSRSKIIPRNAFSFRIRKERFSPCSIRKSPTVVCK